VHEMQQQTVELVAPRINPRQRLSAPLTAKLGRPRSDHLARDLPRHPKLAADPAGLLSASLATAAGEFQVVAFGGVQ
jgi:hypothetical protein